jgi:hypothetical protein
VGLKESWGLEVLIYFRCQEGGPGVDRAMTSSMGAAGSVTTHVLRNEVLQKHIDVRSRVGRGPWYSHDSED